MERTLRQSEKQKNKSLKGDFMLPVMEIFGPTLQGEGNVIGMQTMFVRLGGCDYRCKRCDSLHAVLPSLMKNRTIRMTPEDVFLELQDKSAHCRMVTFSGGNPCMWDLSGLIEKLQINGWYVNVETQGTLLPDWLNKCDYITVSPKTPGMGEKFEPDKFRHFYTQFRNLVGFSVKLVIFDEADVRFAADFAATYPSIRNKLFLSLGNRFPPNPAQRDELLPLLSMKEQLLWNMRDLYEAVKIQPELSLARFLPQMHVLLWENELGR